MRGIIQLLVDGLAPNGTLRFLRVQLCMAENVGAAPLLQFPKLVCYCYTTFSIYMLSIGRDIAAHFTTH